MSSSATEAQRYVLQSMAMKESSEDEIVVGFAWYRPEQWQRVRDISLDSEDMADTYLEWLQLAEQKLSELRNSGVQVEKVDINSEELILWCNEHDLEVTGESRSKYAAEKVSELDEKRSLISGRT